MAQALHDGLGHTFGFLLQHPRRVTKATTVLGPPAHTRRLIKEIGDRRDGVDG
jgi:hypothetical protein